jgi:NADH:ubiquinone oxidoreductase subunit C
METIKIINALVPSALISDRDVELEIQTTSSNLLTLMDILKNHSLTQTKNLMEITFVDRISQIGVTESVGSIENSLRFYLTYFLLSVHYNFRVRVSVQTSELMPVLSITSLFSSINWYEREAYDMGGIFFTNHPDLRRILTDYGFQGYPLRKDFPLSGFTDLFYNDARKLLSYEPVTLIQSFRKFSFTSPWIKG